jgi:hypothetical protein
MQDNISRLFRARHRKISTKKHMTTEKQTPKINDNKKITLQAFEFTE